MHRLHAIHTHGDSLSAVRDAQQQKAVWAATAGCRSVQRSVVTVADHAIVLLLEPCRVGQALIIDEAVDLPERGLVRPLLAADVRTVLCAVSRHG
jgi:hypothetical protein